MAGLVLLASLPVACAQGCCDSMLTRHAGDATGHGVSSMDSDCCPSSGSHGVDRAPCTCDMLSDAAPHAVAAPEAPGIGASTLAPVAVQSAWRPSHRAMDHARPPAHPPPLLGQVGTDVVVLRL